MRAYFRTVGSVVFLDDSDEYLNCWVSYAHSEGRAGGHSPDCFQVSTWHGCRHSAARLPRLVFNLKFACVLLPHWDGLVNQTRNWNIMAGPPASLAAVGPSGPANLTLKS
jgi:hypothetical protein